MLWGSKKIRQSPWATQFGGRAKSHVQINNAKNCAHIKGYLRGTDKGSSGGRGEGRTIMTICGSKKALLRK